MSTHTVARPSPNGTRPPLNGATAGAASAATPHSLTGATAGAASATIPWRQLPSRSETTTRRLVILDRLTFCSVACLEDALEAAREGFLEGDTETERMLRSGEAPDTTTVSLSTAHIIKCRYCGLYLDETEIAQPDVPPAA